MRTREGIAIARSRGKLKGKQPKAHHSPASEPVRMEQHGDYTIAISWRFFCMSQ